jgi:type IV pilus assembly protein PilQ
MTENSRLKFCQISVVAALLSGLVSNGSAVAQDVFENFENLEDEPSAEGNENFNFDEPAQGKTDSNPVQVERNNQKAKSKTRALSTNGMNAARASHSSQAAPITLKTEVTKTAQSIPMPLLPNRPITLEFSRARLKQVFAALSAEGGVNFVFPDDVGNRRVSFKLAALPLDQAVNAIVQTEGLRAVEVAPKIIRIDTEAKLMAEATVNQQEQRVNQLAPNVQIVRLNHARAKDILPSLQQLVERELPGTAGESTPSSGMYTRLAAHERINAVIVEAPMAQLQKIMAIIDRLDIATPQAEIATRIVELQKSAAKFVGVNWDGGMNYDGGRGLGFGSLSFPNSLTAPFAIDTGAPSSSVGDFRFRIGSITDALDLDLRLKLQESEGRAEILQSGKVIVQDGGTAKIAAGTSLFVRPVQLVGVGSESGGGDLNEVKLQLILEVGVEADGKLPTRGITISKDGIVRIPVRLISMIPQAGSESAVIAANSRELQTEVVKKSGDTAVIGGIFNTTKKTIHTGVPGLSKIPIIGALFRSTSEVDEQTELLIMMTPKVVDPIENTDAQLSRFDLSSRADEDSDDKDKTKFPSDVSKNQFKDSRRSLGL